MKAEGTSTCVNCGKPIERKNELDRDLIPIESAINCLNSHGRLMAASCT